MPQIQRRESPYRNTTPDVPRPDLAIWQPLESERIRWEGQVQIVGQETDLAALLVITGKRLALIANNEIALEFPLAWMRPEPKLVAENGIRLFVTPSGDSQISQPMLLRAQAGRGAAMEIAAALTGKSIASRTTNSSMQIPAWRDRVGASPSVALPHLGAGSTSVPTTPKASWPPLETSGVQSKPENNARPKPSANIAPWRVGGDLSEPRPVPTGISRAARSQGTAGDGYTVTEKQGNSETANAAVTGQKHRVPMWIINLAIVAMLVAGFGYAAIERGYAPSDLQSLVPANIAGYLGIDKSSDINDIAQVPAIELGTTDETTIAQGGDNRLLPVKNTSVGPVKEDPTQPTQPTFINNGDSRNSIGGPSNLPVTAGALATADATKEATNEAIDLTIVDDVVSEEAVTEPAIDVVEETATAPAEPVIDEAVVDDATSEPVVTEQATDPTMDPTVMLPTETPVTPEPTVVPTQSVTLVQPASVADGTLPNQAFQQGGIRYSIDAVATGTSIPDLPEINDIGQTWVILTLTGASTSSSDQIFDMSSFVLNADGNAIPLDDGTAWVNSLLGNDPTYGNFDTATWAPGEQHQFTLTFLAPTNVTNLVLTSGEQQIALDAAVTNSVGLRETARDEAPAATVSGSVTEIIDGQTIVVDIDGELITVRYLGIDAPTGDACYANESTLVNAALVEGQTVTMERQSVDTNARGVWVRDVWVTDTEGNQILMSQALVDQGAAPTKVSEPNNRYAGWLNSTEMDAQQNNTGLWSTCGDN